MRFANCVFPVCILVSAISALAAPADNPIRNATFERGSADWEVHVYGAKPIVARDDQVKHAGPGSLRVSAAQPSDTALGQEILLSPRQWYRFTGWVRTLGLVPRDARTFGTYQIQRPGGAGIIAAGANHQGDCDWTDVRIIFESPADGKVRIAPFFAGFGKGIGMAWFADLEIAPIDLAKAPLRVTRTPLCPGRISPYQYGQFIEYLCDLVPSLWAEKLYDGSFEGLSPYKVAYLKQTDFRERPWYPSGQCNRGIYSLDPSDPFSGKVAQKIEATGDTPCTLGISQDGIAIQKQTPCVFSCFMRRQDGDGAAEVVLHREGVVYATATFQPTAEWKKYSARLAPSGSDSNATLTIRFHGPGIVWLDIASLMPSDAVGGWRADAVAALRELKPGIIRFGGSALDAPGYGGFDWRGTIGDPDHRTPFRAWGGLQPTGAGLEEIVQLCRLADAEPLICVRTTGQTPADAADEVQYFNGGADTAMGAQRARNGHPEPYHIKFWQIGNERSGPEYETQLRPFADAMRKADPKIRLLSSYPKPGVLKAAGDVLAYVCPHQYDCANLVACQSELDAVRGLLAAAGHAGQIHVGVTEWNTTAGDFGPRRAMLWTLANALAVARYHNLLHRNCDLVEIANRSNLANSFCSGIIQTDNHRLYKTPAYYAQQLYATLAGDQSLKIDSSVPADTGPDVSATLSSDGRKLTLFAINAGPDPITRPIDVSALGMEPQEISVWTLADQHHAGERDAANTFGDPLRVSVSNSKMSATASPLDYRFEPYSLTVLQWQISR
jgi:alpha-N-arabinofuranosidase